MVISYWITNHSNGIWEPSLYYSVITNLDNTCGDGLFLTPGVWSLGWTDVITGVIQRAGACSLVNPFYSHACRQGLDGLKAGFILHCPLPCPHMASSCYCLLRARQLRPKWECSGGRILRVSEEQAFLRKPGINCVAFLMYPRKSQSIVSPILNGLKPSQPTEIQGIGGGY